MKGVPAISKPPKSRVNLDAALDYAQRLGWFVFPQHWILDGHCSCCYDIDGKLVRKKCKSNPAKHPRTQNGLKDATLDVDKIKQWWRKWPDANIGVRTGVGSGLVVIDVDSYDKKFDAAAFHNVIGQLPDALPFAESPRGGKHYYFKHPGEGYEVSAKGCNLPHGVEVKGDGGCITVAPSVHANGKPYSWACPPSDDMLPPPLPEQLLSKIARRQLTEDESLQLFTQYGKELDKKELVKLLMKGGTVAEAERRVKAAVSARRRKLQARSGDMETDRTKIVSLCVQHILGMHHNGQYKVDNQDGSNRLFRQAIRCVEFDLNEDEAVCAINTSAVLHPFPASWTDEQILERYKQADDRADVIRGSRLDPNQISEREVVTQYFDKMVEKPITWLWPSWLPYGRFAILAGDPDLGKTFVTCDIVARVTHGTPFPRCTVEREPMSVAIFNSGEDEAESVLLPRLKAAGADLSRVASCTGIRRKGDVDAVEYKLNIREDLQTLSRFVRGMDNCGLVILEPIDFFLPRDIDSYKKPEVQDVLTPLNAFAAEHNIVLLGVLHTRKAKGDKAIDAVMGSRAFVTTARAGIILTKSKADPSGDTVNFTALKNNYAKKAAGFRLSIVDGHVEWSKDPLVLTADQALDDTFGNEGDGRVRVGSKKRATGEEAILRVLLNGPMQWKALAKLDAIQGVNPATLRRARERLTSDEMIERNYVSVDGVKVWLWSIIEREDAETEERF